jgi:hypothetical protein
MKKSAVVRSLGLILGLSALALGPAAAGDEAADIVKRNVAAAGGEARLASVRTLSFSAGGSVFTATPAGTMKVVVPGLPPAVIEVTLVEPGRVRRNRLDGEADISGVDKVRLTLYARLFGGCFTLRNFAAGLRYEGVRRFGPETFHRLGADLPPMTVEFDVGTADGLLRQVALRGANPDGSRYEEFFDMGPYLDVAGVMLPSSWFRSQVGGRGSLSEIAEAAFDAPLETDFFARADVNVGEAKAGAGALEGCVLNLLEERGGFVLVTNWTSGRAVEAGLASGESLTLTIGDLEREAVYYANAAEAAGAGAYKPGARIVTFDPQRGASLMALFYMPAPEEAAAVKAEVKGLSPIAVRKR